MKTKKILSVGILFILLTGIVGFGVHSLTKVSEEENTDIVERLLNYAEVKPNLSYEMYQSDVPSADYFYKYENIYYKKLSLSFSGQIASSLLLKVNEYAKIDKLGIMFAYKDDLNEKNLSNSFLLNEKIISSERTIDKIGNKLNIEFDSLWIGANDYLLTDLDREFVYCSYFMSGNKYYFGEEVTSSLRAIAKSAYEKSVLNKEPLQIYKFISNYHRDSCLDEITQLNTKYQMSVVFSESEQSNSIYHDEKNGYANIAIRGVGQISTDLYNKISKTHAIEKFGVAIVKYEDLLNYIMMKRDTIKSMLYQDERLLYLENSLSEVVKSNDFSTGFINWYGTIIDIENTEKAIKQDYYAISYMLIDGKYEFLNTAEFSLPDIAFVYLKTAKDTDKNYNVWKYLASFAE